MQVYVYGTKKDHHGTPIAQAYGVLATKNEKRTLK